MLENPTKLAVFASSVLKMFPIAAAITEAFQVKIKIAPAPYKSEKTIQKNSTFILLKKILPKISNLVHFPVSFPWTLLFTETMACSCKLKILSTTGCGRKTYG